MKKVIFMFCAMFFAVMTYAQVPRVQFWKSYLNVPIVKTASMANGKISNEMLSYILKKSNPAEVKYAIINALGSFKKAAENVEINKQTIEKYFNNNFENAGDFSYETILNLYGMSSAMSFCLLDTYSHPFEYQNDVVESAKIIHEMNISNSSISQSTYIIYNLIVMENALGLVSQKGFLPSVKNILRICNSDAVELNRDMRQDALSSIVKIMEEEDKPQAIITIISKSSNPYQISINGKVIGTMDGYETYEYQCSPGYYHIKAVQVSGYAFSPTVNNRDVNVEDGETATITIGYED